MTRRPVFWAALALLSLGGWGFALSRFGEAFPVLALELEMSREEALERSDALAREAGWGTADFRQAASFRQSDPEVQTYVELEGGGAEAFQRLVADGPYRPWVWEVRHFAEGEVSETRVRFTPEGRPYGFRLTLPEDAPGPSLAADAARALAEAEATARWGVDMAEWEPAEASAETRPGGRTDHTFVYEHAGAPLGDARVRLRLGVAGDRPSEVGHFVDVPQAFLLRYQEMRSANDTLALLSNLVFLVGFLVVGGGVATFFLLRGGWVLWRPALLWGVIVAALLAAGMLNQIPLAWMDYDTALGASTFLLQQVGVAVVTVVFGAPFLAFVFLLAESLGRRAFPHHPQQWRLASKGALESDAVLGRTLGAYLWLGVDLGFVVFFYWMASRLDGWWIPSDTLIDPDLLATPFPWLMALSLALFAGMWEESLFRAVPLAGAKLLGERFGGTRTWVGFALVLQALVFAAAHANYAQQPAYARVVELFVPALLWGVFYLRFGLLPVILIHFLHNFAFFSVVLFSASGGGVWIDRLIALACMALPLALVVWARARRGRVRELAPELRNGGWHPGPGHAQPARSEGAGTPSDPRGDAAPASAGPAAGGPQPSATRDDAPAEPPTAPSADLPPGAGDVYRRLVVAGLVGGLAWTLLSDPRTDAPRLEVGRARAAAIARLAVEARGVEGADWEALAAVEGGPAATHRFVWETAGEDVYRQLLGDHLRPPLWRVRFARFGGPLEARAEEWSVAVGPDGRLREIVHRLPEGRDGASLDVDEARRLAEAALRESLSADPATLREVAAEARQLPARRDWLFAWTPLEAPPLAGGEARLEVEVAGDEVVAARRSLRVSEAWEREDRRRATRSQMIALGSAGLAGLLALAAAAVAVVSWSRGRFAVRAFLGVALAISGAQLAGALNSLPGARAALSTAEPVRAQLFALAAGLGVGVLLLAGALGLLAGLAHTWLRPLPRAVGARSRLAGFWAGVTAAGALAAAGRLTGGAPGPEWPDYAAAGALIPALQDAVDALTAVVAGTTVLLLAIGALERWTHGWTRRRGEAAGAVVWLGILASGAAFESQGALLADVGVWLVRGALLGATLGGAWALARRLGPQALPLLVATVAVAGRLEGAFARPYPGSATGAVLAAAVAFGAALVWARALQREERSTPRSEASPPPRDAAPAR